MISQIEAIQPGVGYSIFSVAFFGKNSQAFLRKTTEVKHKQKETGREACLSDANVWGGESQVFLGKNAK